MDFDRYVEVFNSGNDDSLVDGWFTDDMLYVGGNRKIEGKEAWRKFLKFAHDGIASNQVCAESATDIFLRQGKSPILRVCP